MSDKTDTQGTAPKETTFRSFSREQGAAYAQHRLDYHPRLYQLVLGYHTATGGRLDTLLDVGCGPGTAARTLAPHFAHAIGTDPSEGMIATAHSLGGVSSASEPIRFEVAAVEEVGLASPPIPDGSVDLLVAATAAHWFDMAGFWPHAARLLRPGGTVALWAGGPLLVDRSMPGAAAVQTALDRFHAALDEHFLPGNRMVQNLYADLQLPWMLEQPVGEFERDSFVRKVWDGTEEGSEFIKEFYADRRGADVDKLVKVLAITGPYIRWRKANVDVAGTEKDPLQVMRKEINCVLEEGGAGADKGMLKGGVAGVLLMVKKRADIEE